MAPTDALCPVYSTKTFFYTTENPPVDAHQVGIVARIEGRVDDKASTFSLGLCPPSATIACSTPGSPPLNFA